MMADQEGENPHPSVDQSTVEDPAETGNTTEQDASSNNKGEIQQEEEVVADDEVVEAEGTVQAETDGTGGGGGVEQIEEKTDDQATEGEQMIEVENDQIAEGETEKVAETEVEQAAEAEAEQEADTATEQGAEAEIEQATEAETEQAAEAETEQATEAETEQAAEAETEKVVEAETEKMVEAETEEVVEAETEKVVEAEIEQAAEAETEKTAEAETEKTAEAEAEKAAEAETEKAAEAETEKAAEAEDEKAAEAESEKAAEAESEKAAEAESEKVAEAEQGTKDDTEAVTEITAQADNAEASQEEAIDTNQNVATEEAQQEGEATEKVIESAQAETAAADEVVEDFHEDEVKGRDEQEEGDVERAAEQKGPISVEKHPETRTQGESKNKPSVNLDATATVKFVLMPSSQVVTLACTLGRTLESLKTHFASELKMPSSIIMLMFNGKTMGDNTTLAELGVGPNGTIQLEMQSADPVNNPIKPYRPRQEYHMPDVITVRVMTEDCEAKDVVVEIERSRTKKPFLGGFRNKNTGIEFHNASAQTMQKPRPPPTSERFCRDTQTCEQKNMRQQTMNTTSTQMTGVGVYVSNAEDMLITPGKYFSADDYWARVLKNVIILQKYYRRWLAKRYVKKLKEDKAKRLEWERQEELRKKKEKEERIKKEYARRINPKTKADFDMLLNCLEKWRQEEMERINSTLTGAERKAALCMLLDQETELLSAIERHKNEANLDNRDKRIMQFLDKAAAAKKWQGHDGKLTYMDTPFTIRAKELRDIYNSINMKYLTQDERLDVLLTLKHTVKEHDCKLTQEIIELIDREADLLMRGVKEGNLTGLRKRISTLFLQYIKTPTFNPEAAKLLKVPQDPSTLRQNINYCLSCGNYLPSTEFFITSNSRNVGRCRNCVKIENDGRQREDHTYYRVMLKALRKSEEAMQDGSSLCFLLQENDLRYLVENIWSNQSVLSAWDDLYDLVLVRWDKHQEWSPWNCILLTHDEAEAHKKLFSLEEGYGQVFIHKVTQKHNLARNYFSRLPGMSEQLRQKLGSRELATKTGPAVAGHSVGTKAQKV